MVRRFADAGPGIHENQKKHLTERVPAGRVEFRGDAGSAYQQDFSRFGDFSDGEQWESCEDGRDFRRSVLRHGEKQFVIVAAVKSQLQSLVLTGPVGRRIPGAVLLLAGAIFSSLEIHCRKFSRIDSRADFAGGAEARQVRG